MSTRLIFKACRSCHVSPLLHQLKLLLIDKLIDLQILILTFKVRSTARSSYLVAPWFCPASTLRSRTNILWLSHIFHWRPVAIELFSALELTSNHGWSVKNHEDGQWSNACLYALRTLQKKMDASWALPLWLRHFSNGKTSFVVIIIVVITPSSPFCSALSALCYVAPF